MQCRSTRATVRLPASADGFDDLEQQVDEGGLTPLSISIAHGIAAGELPRHHDDPFDRMLIAQAFAEGLTVVTHDKRFAEYDVAMLPT